MQEAGFEPAPSKRIVPETIALDHSATLAYIDKSKVEYRNWCDSDFNERKKETNKQTNKEGKKVRKKERKKNHRKKRLECNLVYCASL